MDGSSPYPHPLLRARPIPAGHARNREICRSDRPVGTGKPTNDSARLAILLASALAIASAAAAEKFQKLSGAQIRAKLPGMEITDEVHWADVYGRDGTLMTFSMGKKTIGKWSVKNDELCLDRGTDFQGCYQVWISGKKVELRREGSSLPLEGVLQPPAKRQ
jgi:hypothetical protein